MAAPKPLTEVKPPNIPSGYYNFKGKWIDTTDDDDWLYGYDDYHGYRGSRVGLRPHEDLLLDAMYAYWSRRDEKGYEYLAECYNKFALRDGETPLIPSAAYIG